MSKSRWFKFYPGDFQSGTRGFTAAQRGAYISLICASWESEDGTLPGDDARLVALAETNWMMWKNRGVKEAVLTKFKYLPNGHIYNQRIMEERQKAGLAVVAVSNTCVTNTCVTNTCVTNSLTNSSNEINGHPSKTPPLRARPRARARSQNPDIPPYPLLSATPPPSPSPAKGQARSAASEKPIPAEPSEPQLPEAEREVLVEKLLGRRLELGRIDRPLEAITGVASRLINGHAPVVAARLTAEQLAQAEAEAIAAIEEMQNRDR